MLWTLRAGNVRGRRREGEGPLTHHVVPVNLNGVQVSTEGGSPLPVWLHGEQNVPWIPCSGPSEGVTVIVQGLQVLCIQ